MVIGDIQIHLTRHRMEQPELYMLWLGGWLRVLQMTFQMKVFKESLIIQNIENPSLKKKRQERRGNQQWQVGPQDELKVSSNENLPCTTPAALGDEALSNLLQCPSWLWAEVQGQQGVSQS